ncbi:PREDICTED: chymotrypsin-2-like [Ceratosolen solmsi marchali]|uniref:Chymotrypsin-2-like n=1 Tax=Ceratosolen solmsi marchali TaxID=326594 RepID=A0AAJ6YCS2_9HYME|nr:PREDICTED: chymotrypsin-2-like [Ceratosolen solmsi marchali]
MLTHRNDNTLLQHFCTGALVSSRDVLTSQHCMLNKDEERIRVLIGSSDWRLARVYKILWWFGYESWARLFRVPILHSVNDIAVIRLSRNVSDDIRPGILTTPSNTDLVNLDVWLAGWGKKENGQNPIIMDVVQVQVISKAECENRVGTLRGQQVTFEDNMFCTATNPFALVHQGDSGGPVIYNNMIVGITKGTCPFPDVYIHPEKINVHFGIANYISFIMSIIREIP